MHRPRAAEASRCALRGPRERAFSKLSSAADSIHQVRASLTEMRLWTVNRSYDLAAADSDLAATLANTYPHLSPDELLAAARMLLAMYERICPDYCVKADVQYPAQKVVMLRRVLHEFDRLRWSGENRYD